MIFSPLPLHGTWAIEAEAHSDERGFFARIWCHDEFARYGIDIALAQASVSYNERAGTVRGMHFAWPPAREGKLIRCVRGRIHDVLLDLRPLSPTFAQAVAVELDADRHNAVYAPPGVAHGFQTLVDAAEVQYMMSEAYRPDLADGVRHDDPAFGIQWPLPVSCIAERDLSWPTFDAARHRERFEVGVDQPCS